MLPTTRSVVSEEKAKLLRRIGSAIEEKDLELTWVVSFFFLLILVPLLCGVIPF